MSPTMADCWKLGVAFVALLLETGCDPAPGRKAAIEKSASDPIVRDVGQLETNVRISEAEKRIDELEREVGELKLTPEKLNLELLTARVAALEAGRESVVADPNDLAPNVPADSNSPARQAGRANGIAPTKTSRTPSLRLPSLEPRARLATPAEAKAFARGNAPEKN